MGLDQILLSSYAIMATSLALITFAFSNLTDVKETLGRATQATWAIFFALAQ